MRTEAYHENILINASTLLLKDLNGDFSFLKQLHVCIQIITAYLYSPVELHLSMKNVIIVKEALCQDGIHSLSVFSVATTFFTKDVLRNMASSALSASTSMKRYVSYNF